MYITLSGAERPEQVIQLKMMSYAKRCASTGRVASAGTARRLAVTVRASADNKFDGFKPSIAAFFPGQGAQSVGMAKDLVAEVPKAKEMFDKAKEILGYDLLQVGVRKIDALTTSAYGLHGSVPHADEWLIGLKSPPTGTLPSQPSGACSLQCP